MFNQNDTIHFSCTQCGKCCGKAPFMHFYDMLQLSNEFFFQTAHHAVLSNSKNPLEKGLIDHLQVLGHTIVMPEEHIESTLFYFIDFMPVTYPSYKACPKLENNLCSIYGKRPSSCKLAPLDAKFDDTQQWRTLNFYKENVDKNEWKCDFSHDQPIVYKNQEIYQTNHNALYFQSVDIIRDITDKYIEFLSIAKNPQDNKHLDAHFKAIFKSVVNNNLMISDMIISLQSARYHNLISEEVAVKFIEDQLAFIEKETKPALSFKRKEDLQTTRLYKAQKEAYVKALKQKIFQYSYENFSFVE